MTAVAPPPNFQNINRQAWSAPNGVANGVAPMNGDDYRQMFMPRKTVQRSNSSSSLASNASASTAIPAPSQANGVGAAPTGDASTWAARKKATRGLWPASKPEPVSGITTARPQSIVSTSSGPSAASAMTALHTPAPMVPSQHNGTAPPAQNGAPRAQTQENSAILHLIPMNGTFDRKTITVPYYPEVLKIGRQTNNKTTPTPLNGFFDSKVLSRAHAEIWADRNGKIWIRDVKSSNGTFVNGQRLSKENQDSDPFELKQGDMLELGIDIVSEDQKTIVHHKVAARVEHAGIYPTSGGINVMDLNFGDMENQQMQGMMGHGGQQQMNNMRGRTSSQGSLPGGRLQGAPAAMGHHANNMQQPRHPITWLQPITMEQVVKKLNAEIKAARQQTQELQQTHHYINSILTTEPKKELSKPSGSTHIKVSPIKDLKARFSDPPAPPPQQPLPEKPDAPSFRRTETVKPDGASSPARSDVKISSLADALASAKQEIEAQSVRVRDLEALLTEERRARVDAEERANQLERESAKDQGQLSDGPADEENVPEPSPGLDQDGSADLHNDSTPPTIVDAAAARLQQRLDSMMSEMNEMKQHMEIYRRRAEDAEADSAMARKTLAEMVEKIRQDDATKASKSSKRRSRSDSDVAQASSEPPMMPPTDKETEEGEIPIMSEKDLQLDGPKSLLKHIGVQTGHLVSKEASHDSIKASRALATRHSGHQNLAVTHGAPAVSILTVVALGVAVMAWLNSYPKVER